MTATIYIDNGCQCTNPHCDEEHALIAVYQVWHPVEEGETDEGGGFYATLEDVLADVTGAGLSKFQPYERGEGYVLDLRTDTEWDVVDFIDEFA